MDNFGRKELQIANRSFSLSGLSGQDPYFAGLSRESGLDLYAIASKYLNCRSCCWDIGANIGLMSLVFHEVCPDGNHLALEPNHLVFDLLRKNLADNNVRNVKAIHACAGQNDGSVRFVENSAYGYVSNAGAHRVDMLSASSLYAMSSTSRLDMVKIDIEGFEFPFLRGAEQVLLDQKPIVYAESNSCCIILNFGESPHKFAEWLFDFFPFVYVVGRNQGGVLHDVGQRGYRSFLHDHLVHRQSIDDLVLSFRALI